MRRRLSRVLGTLLLAAAATQLHAQFEYRGLTVLEIRFEPDAVLDVEPLSRHVKLEIGEPLTIADVQSSIKALFGTGDFRDIRVDAEPAAGGVIVTFRLSLHYRVGTVEFRVEGEQLERATRESAIEEGEVLSLSRVDRSAVAIDRIYNRFGYLEATVDPEVQFQRAENRANVIFHITSGPRARIGSVDFDGDLEHFTPRQLLAAMRSEIGAHLDTTRAREDAERIRRFLIREDHRMARARYVGETYDPATQTVSLEYAVDPGPLVEVVVEGVPSRAVRRQLPFGRDDAYSEDRVLRAADRIRTRYQARGFFFVEVDVNEELRFDRHVITYTIDPGERYDLAEVRFEGNQTLPDEELRDVVSASPSGFFRELIASIARRPIAVTSQQLSEDRDALIDYYRMEGFFSVDVERPRVVRRGERDIDVVFRIQEGPRTMVDDVRIDVVGDTTRRLPEMRVQRGRPLNPTHLSADIVALQTFYGDRGFVEVEVNQQVDASDDRTSATVIYNVIEGPRVVFGSVSVRGNSYTDEDVVLKKARIPEGDPLSYRTILEAQQRLYRLGIFRLVDISPVRAATAAEVRDIVIRVEEGQNLTVSGSLGYSTDEGARGTAAISHRNLFGTARLIGLEGTISERVNRYRLNYREPFVFGYDLPTQLTIFRREELRARERAELRSLGTSVEMTRVVRDRFRWSLRYEYRINECVAGELCELATGPLPIPGIDPEDQEIQISSITPSAFWDRRDDAVNPTRGHYVGGSLEYAFPLIRAETEFLKGFGQGTYYLPLTSRSQLVGSVRLGAIEPLSSDGPGARVPFAERFLAGGETSHRGFGFDQLGIACRTLIPRPEDIPEGLSCEEYVATADDVNLIAVGGNALVLANIEYRFPIVGSLRGALFVDAGNVWRRIDTVDLSELRYGAGVGFRYLTPVGPLRLDVGFNLDREPWEDRYETFLTLGYGF
jgi:outer membrane protein insertion porin family